MSGRNTRTRYPVLIAGGGPVGLALAIELGWVVSACLVVEQTDGTVEFPTTNLANTRTCEHLRLWGIADRIRFESGYPTNYPRNYVFVTRWTVTKSPASIIPPTALPGRAPRIAPREDCGSQNPTSTRCCMLTRTRCRTLRFVIRLHSNRLSKPAKRSQPKSSTRKPDARKPSARIIWLVAMAVAAVSGALWI